MPVGLSVVVIVHVLPREREDKLLKGVGQNAETLASIHTSTTTRLLDDMVILVVDEIVRDACVWPHAVVITMTIAQQLLIEL